MNFKVTRVDSDMLMRYWNLPMQKLRLRDWLLAFSTAAMTMLVSWRGGLIQIAAGVLVSFVSILVLSTRLRIVDGVLECSLRWTVISGFFATLADFQLWSILQREYEPILREMKKLTIPPDQLQLVRIGSTVGLGLLAWFALFCLFSLLLPHLWAKVSHMQASLDPMEKRFLLLFIGLGIIAVLVSYSLTNCFYLPKQQGVLIEYDVVYTADTGVLVNNDAFVNIGAIQNDVNQMLFGVVALPLGVFCHAIAYLLFFIPNSYAIVLAITQLVLLGCSIVLLTRLTRYKGIDRTLYLLLVSIAYPTLLFALNLEQYVISLFCLLALIHTVERADDGADGWLLAATGTLMTSAMLFPLVVRKQGWKQALLHLVWIGVCFGMLVSIFGKLPYLLNIFAKQNELMSWYGGASLMMGDKLLQWFAFIGNCLFAPNAVVDVTGRGFPRFVLPVVSGVDWLGVVLLGLAVVGFWRGRRRYFIRVCGAWVVFSFFVMVLLGWGTIENGLILYALYFGWAYLTLIYEAIQSVLHRYQRLQFVGKVALILWMLIINLSAIVRLVQFGIQYYPV